MLAKSLCIQLFLLTLCLVTVDGAFRFANYFQDHMVLQRAPQQAIVWGYADTFDTPITLTINDKVYHAKTSSTPANDLGESIWSVMLDAQPAEGPFQVKVTHPLANGTIATITLDDILFGDVWVCSGQSNMSFSVSNMYNATEEIANAGKYPKVRLFTAARNQSDIALEELLHIWLNWSVASSASVGSGYTSAVCWLYGRMIHTALGGRPIGLVHSSWGGTNIELWTPPDTLKECNITSRQPPRIENENNFELGDFNKSDLYNAMMHPFTRMVIKGVIWYQGEANINYDRDQYTCTFSKMIQTWRNVWHTRTNGTTDPTFPFGFVQLSTNDPTGTLIGGTPWIRWHQTFDVGYVPNSVVPNVFMAVSLDLRDDERGIHPRDKLDVGYRLSQSGLAVAYGFKNVTYQGPIVAQVTVSPDSSQVNVTYSSVVTSSIELRDPNGFEVCCLGKALCIANETLWVATVARTIPGEALTIALTGHTSCQSKPLNGLRYLWRETPCLFKKAAVYSGEDSDLPAPPYIKYFD